eukprot:Skav201547  [mRNA]  locus=scaffold1616:216084:216305:- [translate_table: standard]
MLKWYQVAQMHLVHHFPLDVPCGSMRIYCIHISVSHLNPSSVVRTRLKGTKDMSSARSLTAEKPVTASYPAEQ